jgi:hypothetical protein
MKVAQHFSVGSIVPTGTDASLPHFPALKCWATFTLSLSGRRRFLNSRRYPAHSSEVEFVDVIFVEDEGRPEQELAPVDEFEFS